MKLPNKNKIVYCHSVKIDIDAGELSNGVGVTRLGPVNMRVLSVLLSSPERIVSRAQIFDVVWANQVISDDVLTRCISDLRKQLSELFENTTVIETIPKRGYRWKLPVILEPSTLPQNEERQPPAIGNHNARSSNLVNSNNNLDQITSAKPLAQSRYSNLWTWCLVGGISLVAIALISLWLVELSVGSNHQKVAVIPIEFSSVESQVVDEFEQVLINKLLASTDIKVLARSAVQGRPSNPFPYFSREFGTDWLIEGKVRNANNQIRLTLSLVDARSATVSYSMTRQLTGSKTALTEFCADFINEARKFWQN